MTSSDGAGPNDLTLDGWSRCFFADEPRLSEAVATYEELGFEVLLVPVTSAPCSECIRPDGDCRVIYIRRRGCAPHPRGRKVADRP
jgi:hypothetical protein